MKLNSYLFVIVLFVCQPAFSKQRFANQTAQNYMYYNGIAANSSVFNYIYYWIIANPNLSHPIPGVVTTQFRTPAAHHISTYSSQNQYSNIVRVQNRGSNAVMVLSNTVNYYARVSFKNPQKQKIKKDFDNCSTDVLRAADYLINMLKGNVETEVSQVVV